MPWLFVLDHCLAAWPSCASAHRRMAWHSPVEFSNLLCFFCKVFLKSDTAVALSLSLNLWITLVSFINIYYEYFCKIPGCYGIKTLLHVTWQSKLRFLDINMHIIEQKIQDMSVIWWRSSKVSDSFYLYFCFLWLLSLAGKMAVCFLDLAMT